jgi:hypothetical protein
MKKLLVLCLLLAVGLSGFSQSQAKAYLGMIPALPDGACTMKSAEKSDYLVKVTELSDQINREITRRKKEQKGFESAYQRQIQQNMAKQMGLSPTEATKMSNGGQLSKEEKMALAEKMMSEKFNMSVGEAKNIQKMSKEGKAAYAQALGTEMMANAQANPTKNSIDQNKNLIGLMQKQQLLAAKIQAQTNKFNMEFTELEKDTSENQTLRKISELTSRINELSGVDLGPQGAKVKSLQSELRSAQVGYCNKFTPRYFDVYHRYLAYITENISDYDRMEEIDHQIYIAQTGVSDQMAEPGLMALELVDGYIGKLRDAFRFAVCDNDQSGE